MSNNTKQLIRFLLSTIAIYVSGAVMPGVDISNVWTAIVMSVILSLLNTFIKPILVLLSLPLTIVTLGLFLLVVNGLMVYLASLIVPGFEINSIGISIIYSILISLMQFVLERIFGVREPRARTNK